MQLYRHQASLNEASRRRVKTCSQVTVDDVPHVTGQGFTSDGQQPTQV